MSDFETGYRQWAARLVREIRTGANLTVEEMSEKTGVSVADISNIEHEQTTPPVQTMDKLVTPFGLVLTVGVDIVGNADDKRNWVALHKLTVQRMIDDLHRIIGELSWREQGD